MINQLREWLVVQMQNSDALHDIYKQKDHDVTRFSYFKTGLNHVLMHIDYLKRENKMYIYLNSDQNLWTVGFYDPDGKFNPESDHDSAQSAADRVHYLNGGTQWTK